VKVWILGSGSAGTAVLLEANGSRVLVDAGFGTRTLAMRLKAIDVAPQSIEACVLTHEHSDHIKGAAAAAKKWGWSLHATRGTSGGLGDAPVQTFAAGDALPFAGMTLTAVATPHDATESVGFVATATASGARAGVFYDMGHASDAVAAACADLDLLVLESNHDLDMLRNGPYPRWLQARIGCRTGHLSNPDAAALARSVAHAGLRHLVLAHLSERCNTPDAALGNMRSAVRGTAFRGSVTAAHQDRVMGPFVAATAASSVGPMQYSLL
jgi:phosphoribosyl 1,2-cyclic phosphodiesterase